ncbi:hypothetical protein D3C86_1285500 [compost metagenome]
MQSDAFFLAALLQELEQGLAGTAAEAVSGNAYLFAVAHNIKIVPIGKAAADQLIGLGVARKELAQRLVRKDHAKAKGIVGLVAFVDVDLEFRIGFLG